MGLEFRGILGVTVSQILSNLSIFTVKMEEKQLKPWGWESGDAHGQTKSPDISLLASKSFSPQTGKKKIPRPHLLTFGYSRFSPVM